MPNKPTDDEAAAAAEEPVRQHLHDETKRPIKAPAGGIPPNLADHFHAKGGKGQFGGKNAAKSRNFRHQGR